MPTPKFKIEETVHHTARRVNGTINRVMIVTDSISHNYILYDVILCGENCLSTLNDVPERYLVPGHRQIID